LVTPNVHCDRVASRLNFRFVSHQHQSPSSGFRHSPTRPLNHSTNYSPTRPLTCSNHATPQPLAHSTTRLTLTDRPNQPTLRTNLTVPPLPTNLTDLPYRITLRAIDSSA
jgi:hypothetical protein